jgi:hypothetical protein
MSLTSSLRSAALRAPLSSAARHEGWETASRGGLAAQRLSVAEVQGLVEGEKPRVLWSSESWSNGVARVLTGHEERDPFDRALQVAAGEGRRFEIDGQGTAKLIGNRSRIYMDAPHRDAELEFYATATDTRLEDLSAKLRSRHQEDDPESNRFGGYGVGFDFHRDTVKFQVEYFHNDHDGGRRFNLPHPIEFNREYGFKVRIESNPEDSKAFVSAFIDYEGEGNWTPVGRVEYARTGYLRNDLNALYMWIRGDANGIQRGVKLRDVVIRAI